MFRPRYLATLCIVIGSLGAAAFTQQARPATDQNSPCAMPSLPAAYQQANMFTDEQEEWLGEAIDQTFRKQFHVVEDPDGYLQKLGERLLAQLPPTKMHYHFFIVDAPELNSFGTGGGRIYIFRRMISFMQSEDELATLLGHEIGHIATHQAAMELTAAFRQLNITEVKDRQDIFNKWNQLVDNGAKIRGHISDKHEQEDQLIADRVGIYAMTRAGYDPTHAVDFMDRSFQTKGKTGGFWSDFFGATSPESKRLREAMRNSGPMAGNCISPLPEASAAHFATWQKQVLEAKIATAKEDVQGMVQKTSLSPHLRGDLNYIQFSRDGAYLLAKDESSIFVLSRDPLANLFRIDATDAQTVNFTPDSRSIVFYDKEFRVEKWDISSKQRSSIYQVALPLQCSQTLLSPTGDVMACMTREFELQLIDVARDKVFFSRKNFYIPNGEELFLLELLEVLGFGQHIFEMHFSPDGHYFVVGHGHSSLGYDLQAHAEVKIGKKAKDLVLESFTFLSGDEIVGRDSGRYPPKIVRAHFPGGDVTDQFVLNAAGDFISVAGGEYVILRHSGPAPLSVVDLKQKKAVMASKSMAFDIFDQWFAAESVGGQIGILTVADQKIIARATLPDSPLGKPRAVAFSSDGKWLAASGPSRGAIWNADSGERMFYTIGFEGAFFDGDRFVGKFPKQEQAPSRVFQFDTSSKNSKLLYPVASENSDTGTAVSTARNWQLGELLLTLAPPKDKQNAGKVELEAHDIRTDARLWEKTLPKGKFEFFHSQSGNTVTMLVIDYPSIKAEAKEDPALNTRLQAIEGAEGKKDSYLLRVFAAQTGNNLGAILVDTGKLSFKVRQAMAIGDTVLVGDSINRTLVYSLKSGTQKGKVFGTPLALSSDGGKMLIEDNKGAADLYDADSLKQLVHFTFPSRIVHAEFTASEGKLMILTADQSIYRVDAAGNAASAQAAK